MASDPLPRAALLATAVLTAAVLACGFGTLALAVLGIGGRQGSCGVSVRVGATEYGGPGDPASGTIGSSGVSLATNPDSYAELGGMSFRAADALGRLPYGTPLEISWGRRSMIAYKRDIGLGGGPIEGHPRVIDLWWKLAGRLGIPYERGRWSGTVRIAPVSGACVSSTTDTLELTGGPRARLLADGQATAPADAPVAVREIIAAGNQIVGRPYRYGGGHQLPLSQIAAAYDCSSSVAHLLWGGGLLGAEGDMTSGQFERWGLPGPGRWVTLYARADHIYMYVAGLRWDTHDAAGAADGSTGIGWHPLARSSAGFVARHPPGL